MDVLGLPVPAAGPLFLLALALHVPAGLACVVTGAVAAFSVKGGRRHRRAGRIYIWAMGVVFATLTVMSLIRWRENAHLFAVGSLTFACGLTGYLMRRRRPVWHIAGMGASYVGLLTGFYVDNGPHLPLWDRLPPLALWLLPAFVGLPIIVRSIGRHRRRG